MTLADFMERLDEQQGNSITHRYDDAALRQRADELTPTFRMWAERAGVGFDELLGEIHDRVPGVAGMIHARISDEAEDVDVRSELEMLACACALQFFCAGALWEQERNMPDLNLDSTGER